jgi:hypothetical protein
MTATPSPEPFAPTAAATFWVTAGPPAILDGNR